MSATVKPPSVTFVTIPELKAKSATSTMWETTAHSEVRCGFQNQGGRGEDVLVLPRIPVK